MRPRLPEPATLLEAGFLLLSAGFVTGLGVLVAGRLLGRARGLRHPAEAAPAAGSVPPGRHQHMSPSPR